MHKRNGIVLLGHGSRIASQGLHNLSQSLQQRHPSDHVCYGFLELQEPSAQKSLQKCAENVEKELTIIPMFLSTGGHVKNDLPLLAQQLQKKFPHLTIHMLPPLGESPIILDMLYERLARPDLPQGYDLKKTILLVLARGTSHPDSNAFVTKMTRLIGEKIGVPMAFSCFLGVTTPSLDDMITIATRCRPQHVIIAPYLLTTGMMLGSLQKSVNKAQKEAPWIKWHTASHIGLEDPLMLRLLEERLKFIKEQQSLACLHCQYRPSWALSVSPIKALLWSVRHTFLEGQDGQVSPHQHAHKPLCKHVLVCVNADCASRGSVHILNAMREKIKQLQRHQTIKVTRTLCLGRCGEGPTVAVYPDGVWYRGVELCDVPSLVTEHLINDRIVQKCLDGIMHVSME